jgi:hypothetical protein
MAETISLQIRSGVNGFFRKVAGSDETDGNIGAIPVQSIQELETTNATLDVINSKLPVQIEGGLPVSLVQSSNGNLSSVNGTVTVSNTLSEVFTASTRTEWFLMNLSEDYTLELWYGTAGTEILVNVLDPGEKYYRSRVLTGFHNMDTGRICVKASNTPVSYIAWGVS